LQLGEIICQSSTSQETHSELHLANLIRKSGSIEVKGIVLAVLDHSVDVVLIYLGIIRRLYIEVSCEFYM
jgi:stage V sporulation protein SpoVS